VGSSGSGAVISTPGALVGSTTMLMLSIEVSPFVSVMASVSV
jgi:hypothetical protein